ncbi:MAG: pentapeptide repeat-containing protein [Xanthobacteraceae bacterium]
MARMVERTTDPPPADASAPQPPVPRIGADGEPVYDQEFFLALAYLGHEVWNRWLASNPEIAVTFEGLNFREAHKSLSFADFRFGNETNFSGVVFGIGANFWKARFGYGTNFAGAIFDDWAYFCDAIFGDGINFYAVSFSDRPNFSGVAFGERADFSYATFGFGADFSDTIWGLSARFNFATFLGGGKFHGAIFELGADFSGVTLSYVADLSGTTFAGDADFSARSFEDWKQLRSQQIESSPILRSWPQEQKEFFITLQTVPNEVGAGPDTFSSVSFSNTRFLGFADFSGRNFTKRCNFTGAQFQQPPSFEAGYHLDRLDLYGAKISFAGYFQFRFFWRLVWSLTRKSIFPTPGWTTDSNIANRLRRMRDLAEATSNHDLERDLYIEERKAERGILLAQYWRGKWQSLLRPKLYAHCLWIAVMSAFSLLADYGRSFVRPFVALALSVPLLWWAYSSVLIPPSDPIKLTDFRRATWAFAISNAVPFVGALTLERDVKLTCSAATGRSTKHRRRQAVSRSACPFPAGASSSSRSPNSSSPRCASFSPASRCAIISSCADQQHLGHYINKVLDFATNKEYAHNALLVEGRQPVTLVR